MNSKSARMYYDTHSQPITSPTKIKIIETSIELFSRRGFSGASVREITKEVGIKESSLYKHFENKQEILETIFANFRRETAKLLPPMEHLQLIIETFSLQQFLERGIDNFLQHIDDPINQKIWRILYIELFHHPMAQHIYLHEIMKRTIDCLTMVFEGMLQRGKMGPINPRTLATEYQYASISLIMEYNLLQAAGQSTEQIGRVIREHVSFFAAKAVVGE